MERRKFEDSFKEAFDGAELDPSDNVWAGIERELEKADGSFKQAFNGAEVMPSDNVWIGIELELEKAEGDIVRRRLFFYKIIAAASITFAMCIAGLGYYIVNRRTAALDEQIASAQITQQDNITSASRSDTNAAATPSIAGNEQDATNEINSNDESVARLNQPATQDPAVTKQPRQPLLL